MTRPQKCDVCGIAEKIVLTKHHYTKEERHILRLPKRHPSWTYRCANCHMAFNKLGAMKYYEIGGYWDTNFMANAAGTKDHPELDRYVDLTQETHVSTPPKLVASYTRSTRSLILYREPDRRQR